METTPDSVAGAPYAVLGEGSAPTLMIPGGPLLDPDYLGDMGGLTEHITLAIPTLPRVRVAEIMPVLESALNELNVDAADVIAHSAGAVAALYALDTWPERIRRLILITPAVSAAGIPADKDGVDDILTRRRAEPGFSEALEAQEQDWNSVEAQRVSFGLWGDEQQRLAEFSVQERQERLQLYYAEPRPEAASLQAAAERFTGPVTVLHGELDLHPTRSQAEALAGLFPHSEVVTLPGAGHYPWLDCPQEFVAAVLAGLR